MRSVERNHLAARMHTCVGAAGDGDRRVDPEDPTEGIAQVAAHRTHPGILGEATESASVVGDLESETLVSGRRRFDAAPFPGSRGIAQTSSSLAIGALSPDRGPSFRMRV